MTVEKICPVPETIAAKPETIVPPVDTKPACKDCAGPIDKKGKHGRCYECVKKRWREETNARSAKKRLPSTSKAKPVPRDEARQVYHCKDCKEPIGPGGKGGRCLKCTRKKYCDDKKRERERKAAQIASEPKPALLSRPRAPVVTVLEISEANKRALMRSEPLTPHNAPVPFQPMNPAKRKNNKTEFLRCSECEGLVFKDRQGQHIRDHHQFVTVTITFSVPDNVDVDDNTDQ